MRDAVHRRQPVAEERAAAAAPAGQVFQHQIGRAAGHAPAHRLRHPHGMRCRDLAQPLGLGGEHVPMNRVVELDEEIASLAAHAHRLVDAAAADGVAHAVHGGAGRTVDVFADVLPDVHEARRHGP